MYEWIADNTYTCIQTFLDSIIKGMGFGLGLWLIIKAING
jgi:hypothetical protein